VLTLLLTVVVVPLLLFGQSGPAQTTPESCRKFVQAFYDWYVPKSDDDHGPMLEGALRDKRVVFVRQLYRLLEEESDAQAKTTELVTPDFDFFLFSQDPCNRYVAQERNVPAMPIGSKFAVCAAQVTISHKKCSRRLHGPAWCGNSWTSLRLGARLTRSEALLQC
jgi:hypothetical protein